MRNRLEDLGRLSVMLRNATEMEIFEDRPCRNKEFTEWVEGLSEEAREDYLHGIPYKLDELQNKLYDMLSIAECRDDLNNPDSYE